MAVTLQRDLNRTGVAEYIVHDPEHGVPAICATDHACANSSGVRYSRFPTKTRYLFSRVPWPQLMYGHALTARLRLRGDAETPVDIRG